MVEEKSTGTELPSATAGWLAPIKEHSLFTSPSRRALSLRWYLVLLVAGTLLPVVLFAVAVVYQLTHQEQAASERRILLAARNLASSVGYELSSTTRTLQALASSESLSQADFKRFHGEATRVVQSQPSWVAVILLATTGQQLVNSRQPFGTSLPSANEPKSLQKLIETRQPIVGDLALGQLKHNLAFPVRVPVMYEGSLRYVLTAVITPQALANAVNEQNPIAGEWTRTVVDGQGVVVARTRNPERFVGQRGTPSFLQRISTTNEGVYQDTTLEGKKVYVAFCRVSGSSWTVAVTVPIDVIQTPAQQAIGIVVGSGLALLLVSGIGAFILSRQISRSITSAALAAEALAQGEHPQVHPLSLKEVALLGQSLEFAADLLAQRERERAENLMRAEAAREEAEAANRIKDEFLAVLSHELRTPLNPILGWANLLRNGKLDAAKTALALETIERNAKLQTQLIEDLLDVARIMQGKLSLNMVPVNLVFIIESAVETVRLAAEAKSIQIQTRFDLTTGQVLGDAARLQQVVWNLLSNAIKFTPIDGRVEVRLEKVIGNHSSAIGEAADRSSITHHSLPIVHYAQITVADTGKGIHPNFLPHVFEYFRQEDSKTTRKFGGLGLGLAIVRHLIELHGGTVEAASLGEDQGATFKVSLPLLREAGKGREVELNSSSSLTLHASPLMGLRVLLVDDDVDTRSFIAFVLEQNQMIVTAVASAKEALKAFEQTPFDLLISDIGMPEMNGYVLMRQLRSKPPQQGGQVPAIALTAYAGEYDQKQALRVGFQRHVAKPVEPEALVRVIVDLVSTGAGKP